MTTVTNRPGFGGRHPDLAALLATGQPVDTHEVSWLGGAMPLRVCAYTTPADLPEDLVSSVRCGAGWRPDRVLRKRRRRTSLARWSTASRRVLCGHRSV